MSQPRYIPEGATEITRYGIDAVVYTYEANGKPLAIAYHGKASKSDFHNYFGTEDQPTQAIERHFDGWKAHAERKASRKVEKKTAPPTKAQTVQAELKANGINSRQVSVRADNYSMGSSIDVTIRDAAISPGQVVPVAYKVERVDRCEITGEILSGGNTYVHVAYSEDVRAERCKELAAEIDRAILKVEHGSNALVPVEGHELFIGAGKWEGEFAIWNDHHIAQGRTSLELAAAIVCNCRQQVA